MHNLVHLTSVGNKFYAMSSNTVFIEVDQDNFETISTVLETKSKGPASFFEVIESSRSLLIAFFEGNIELIGPGGEDGDGRRVIYSETKISFIHGRKAQEPNFFFLTKSQQILSLNLKRVLRSKNRLQTIRPSEIFMHSKTIYDSELIQYEENKKYIITGGYDDTVSVNIDKNGLLSRLMTLDLSSENEKKGFKIRAMKYYGELLAIGDVRGYIKVFNMKNRPFEEVFSQLAHNDEVLTIDFIKSDDFDLIYMATAGRDNLIHLFSARHQFQLVNTFDEHISAVTGVKFVHDITQGKLYMLSCGLDRYLVVRIYSWNNPKTFLPIHIEVDKQEKYYSMALDEKNLLVYLGQRKKCTVFSIRDRKIKGITLIYVLNLFPNRYVARNGISGGPLPRRLYFLI
jgi:WD40 repeat protein